VLGYPLSGERVACPFFKPSVRVDPEEWLHAPRLTLIDEYRGTCGAGEAFEPEASAQRDVCNCGYARGRCDRFPEGSPDAVRFSVIGEERSVLRIVYAFENDHSPVTHGIAEPGVDVGDPILTAQIRAFSESYRLALMRAPVANAVSGSS
jgi:hypothetical protein